MWLGTVIRRNGLYDSQISLKDRPTVYAMKRTTQTVLPLYLIQDIEDEDYITYSTARSKIMDLNSTVKILSKFQGL